MVDLPLTEEAYYKHYPHGYMIAKWTGGNVVEMHRVRTPSVSEKGFYRQATSGGSFGWRELKRKFPDGRPSTTKFYYSVKQIWDFHFNNAVHEKSWKRTMPAEPCPFPWDGVPIVDHPDLWSFYEAIGYDHKRKKHAEPV